MFRTVPLALAACLFAASPAIAQRGAPVSQGATSTDLATSTARLQSSTADLQIRVDDLQAENARLNGKIETLEFLLSQTRDEINHMQGDDQEIGRQLSAIQNRLDAQNSLIAELKARPAPIAMGSSTPGTIVTTGQTPVVRPVTTNGPRVVTRSAETPSVTTPIPGVTTTGNASTPSTGRASNPSQTGSLGTLPASSLPGEAGPLFADAKSKLLQFDYAGAEQAFNAFLSKFGSDPQAGEAQYWLGEVQYQQGAYAESGAAYTHMIQTYPNDPRAPDALVKLARSLRLVGEGEKACAALDALPERYPNASGVTNNLAAVERSRSACDG